MSLEMTLKHYFDTLASPEKGSSLPCSLLCTLTAATLTENAAQHASDTLTNEDDRDQIDMILQASRSRREELTVLLEKEQKTKAAQTIENLIFVQGVSIASEGTPQRDLRNAIDLPLTAIRVGLDGMKLLHRLADLATSQVACEVETAMNLNLATITSLRTIIEVGISQLNHKTMAAEVQDELREIANKAESLSNDIVQTVRSTIF